MAPPPTTQWWHLDYWAVRRLRVFSRRRPPSFNAPSSHSEVPVSIQTTPSGLRRLSPLRAVSGTAIAASNTYLLPLTRGPLSSFPSPHEIRESAVCFAQLMRAHCDNLIATSSEYKKTVGWKITFTADTSLAPPLVSHPPTASSAPSTNEEKEHNVRHAARHGHPPQAWKKPVSWRRAAWGSLSALS